MVRVHGGQVPSTAQRDAAPDRNRGSFDTPKLKIVGQGAVTLDLIATADNPSVTLRIVSAVVQQVPSDEPFSQEIIGHAERQGRFRRAVEHRRTVSDLFIELGEYVVQFKVAELFEDLIVAFDFGHETVEVSV